MSIILKNIELLKNNPQDVEIRNKLLRASNLAGLAFSNTKTAAAHSMSYPLTISYGIPHGIACSMPIIPLLRINEKAIKTQLNTLFDKIGIANLSELARLILNIPKNIIGFTLKDWQVSKKHLDDITERSFTKSRMANNIINLNNDDILWVFKEIY
ncbi:MAG: iron-containing alcohol dehydrogenase [Planctomycetia bacterium]|nr:iron-containing alcohol dehydrogenase [Planctomycetia bacterium]